MDGTKRSRLHRGLRVAIVLKEDQPTGRRTVGEIGQILSPGENHPRGIKVRLTDGRVGRVQEILPPLQPAAAENTATKTSGNPQPIRLVVLLIERNDGCLYTRTIESSPGEIIAALGLDYSSSGSEHVLDLARNLCRRVTACEAPPMPLYEARLTMQDQSISLSAFTCKGSGVIDDEHEEWDWVGWLTRPQVEELLQNGDLSEESEILYAALKQKNNY